MGLSVGVMADNNEGLGDLARLVIGAGHVVSASVESHEVSSEPIPKVDAWVVNVDLKGEHAEALMSCLEDINAPVVYDDEDLTPQSLADAAFGEAEQSRLSEEFLQRVRRLNRKLESLTIQAGLSENHDENFKKAREVWVLAASTGGPSAVAEFLDGIPDDLTGVAFLYVQHIDANALKSLRQVVEQHSSWSVFYTDEASVMQEKAIYIISPSSQVNIEDDGTIRPANTPWVGDYSPSIDQVIAQVARLYGQRGGAVVFTGMGDDGARSCALLRHSRGQVWVQSAQSCTIDSMPASVEKKLQVDVCAEPTELARKFVAYQRSGTPSQPPLNL